MRPYPDQVERVNSIIKELERKDIQVKVSPKINEKLIQRVHDKGYISFLKSIPENIEEIAPTALNFGGQITSESSFFAKLGHYFFDPTTPLTANSYTAALSSVATALAVVSELRKGTSKSFGLCRPPGHHASVLYGGGYCIFNNVAIATQFLVDKGNSISILDLDYHHGNGTQSIFYRSDKVQYISIHGDPNSNYPYYWGFADERGEGMGLGFNYNIPVTETISADRYLENLDETISIIQEYHPDVVMVSMGFDCYVHDPLAGMNLDLHHFKMIGEKLSVFSKLGVILEGGYHIQDIGKCFYQFYKGITT